MKTTSTLEPHYFSCGSMSVVGKQNGGNKMELDKSDEKVDMLLGKKENPALSKMLGKKFTEESILGKQGKEHKRSKYEEELTDKKIKCPKCGHEFVEE